MNQYSVATTFVENDGHRRIRKHNEHWRRKKSCKKSAIADGESDNDRRIPIGGTPKPDGCRSTRAVTQRGASSDASNKGRPGGRTANGVRREDTPNQFISPQRSPEAQRRPPTRRASPSNATPPPPPSSSMLFLALSQAKLTTRNHSLLSLAVSWRHECPLRWRRITESQRLPARREWRVTGVRASSTDGSGQGDRYTRNLRYSIAVIRLIRVDHAGASASYGRTIQLVHSTKALCRNSSRVAARRWARSTDERR
uniref:Uncharacterized protein n=1 Tax=Plectus sambesii TaxID=2011161 RepID=A0A914W1B4_9BILA